jgi:hypothetical protein
MFMHMTQRPPADPSHFNADSAARLAQREPDRPYESVYIIHEHAVKLVCGFDCSPMSPDATFVPGIGSMSKSMTYATHAEANRQLIVALEREAKQHAEWSANLFARLAAARQLQENFDS